MRRGRFFSQPEGRADDRNRRIVLKKSAGKMLMKYSFTTALDNASMIQFMALY